MRLITYNRIKKTAVLIIVSLLMMTAVSCKGKEEEKTYRDFLGEEIYDASVFAMVVETIEGEEEPGVIYRKVLDFNNVISRCDIPICLYFFSSTKTDSAGVTAGVEDIAQLLDGRLLVVGIDILQNRDLVGKYDITMVPDFVLVEQNVQKAAFGSEGYDYWTTTDVYNWLVEQGV